MNDEEMALNSMTRSELIALVTEERAEFVRLLRLAESSVSLLRADLAATTKERDGAIKVRDAALVEADDAARASRRRSASSATDLTHGPPEPMGERPARTAEAYPLGTLVLLDVEGREVR